MVGIEFLINVFSKKVNEKITKLIDHEYVRGSFLFNIKLIQMSFNKSMIGNFRSSNIK
jgi:hypothetical protein